MLLMQAFLIQVKSMSHIMRLKHSSSNNLFSPIYPLPCDHLTTSYLQEDTLIKKENDSDNICYTYPH